jgi:segregation and condensation protein B
MNGEKSMNELDLKHLIEATLLAAGRPVTTQQLLDLFEERERPTAEQLQQALQMLSADYEPRGIELVEIASGWRIQVRPRSVDVVSRLWQERPSRYSRALLETLALIAYRQPITRSEIEEIRGVSISSTIMRTMQERNWIRVVGHREVPGRPELLGTTREFLDYFGLKSLDQLPTLADLRDVENIGVQLELPGGDNDQPATAANIDLTEGGGESEPSVLEHTADASAVGADDVEAAEDAETVEDDDETEDDGDTDASTLVAANDPDEHRAVREPPTDQG